MQDIYTEFFEHFEIPKVKCVSPGRDYDDDGHPCSWYIDWCYPDIDGNLTFELLALYDIYGGDPIITRLDDAIIKEAILKGLIDLSETESNLKASVQDMFQDYKGEDEE